MHKNGATNFLRNASRRIIPKIIKIGAKKVPESFKNNFSTLYKNSATGPKRHPPKRTSDLVFSGRGFKWYRPKSTRSYQWS
jgi:hypothetical protein